MEDLDRFLPRVWTGKEYFYPVFSELGITYENPNKEYIDENIKPLRWAFGWHFGVFVEDKTKECGYRYERCDGGINWDYQLEQCTGKQDKNGKIIHENDIVYRKDFAGEFTYIVKYDKECCIYRLENIKERDKNSILGLYIPSDCLEVIGNINENKELLNDQTIN